MSIAMATYVYSKKIHYFSTGGSIFLELRQYIFNLEVGF